MCDEGGNEFALLSHHFLLQTLQINFTFYLLQVVTRHTAFCYDHHHNGQIF